MGVTSLWQILEPVKQHVPLSSLRGKTLAVDLSLWVCEAQTVKKMMGVVRKPHLRNLYFRISSSMMMGIHLVFVMEGEPPKLKANTMEKRTEVRFGPSKKSGTAKTGRSRFKSLLKECLEMLECLGVPWVQAAGEAEAMCAYLNANGHVDGCITNDGDAFLYGARTVYRNFTMNVKDPHVDCYLISAIEEKLGCRRETLIGLAILLGCDYLPKGVPGVGKEQALKLIRTLRGQSLLKRFEQWKDHAQNKDIAASAVRKVTHCAVCRHPGSYNDHEYTGCHLCGTVAYCEPHNAEYCCPCDSHSSEQVQPSNPVEDGIRKKAKACEGFPFPEVIQEYLVNKDKPVKITEYQRPDLLSFQRFALEKMDWTRHYACEKLCALLTNHDMNRRKAGHTDPQQLQALRIVKTRVKNGIPCFEIEWQKPDHYAEADDQTAEPFFITIEESALFQAAYPEIVSLYRMEKLKIGKEKRKGKKNKRSKEKESLAGDDDVADLLTQLNLESSPETFSSSDSKSDFKKSSDFQIFPEKDSKAHSASVAADRSAAVRQSQDLLPSSLIISQNTENVCSLGGSQSSQGQFAEQAAASYASSAVSDLQLSSIDWEGTSFGISPTHVKVACSESESGALQFSPPHCKTATIITPYSACLPYNPDLLSCMDCSVSDSDLPRGQAYLPVKDVIQEPSALRAFSKVTDMSPFGTLQKVDQIKRNSGPEGLLSSSSTQLKDNTKEMVLLSEKHPRGPSLEVYQRVLKDSENPFWETKKPSSGVDFATLEHTCLESNPQASPKLTKVLVNCRIRKKCAPTILKSPTKKSVCQNGYPSGDSDDEAVGDRRRECRVLGLQRKQHPAQQKTKSHHRNNYAEAGPQILPWGKEPGLSTELPAEKQSSVHIHNSLRAQEATLEGSGSHLQESGSNSDTCADSPLPLSERLKLRLQSN